MKITKELALKLIAESPSFREEVIEQLFSIKDSNRESILANMSQIYGQSGKIPAIKYIKSNIPTEVLLSAFPELSLIIRSNRDETPSYGSVSLKSAKEFVEFWTKK